MVYKGIPFPDIDPVAVHIGSFGLRWYSLAYLVGIFTAWWLAKRMLSRYPSDFKPEMVERWPVHVEPPDHYDRLSSLLELSLSQSGWLMPLHSKS